MKAQHSQGGQARAILELKRCTKEYGSFTALRDIDLTVLKGEFITLLGPSGSGKSTLLNLIAGVTQPTCGSITLNGRDVTGLPPQKRDLGMVFQNYALFPHMTVFENVAYPLRARRMTRDEIKQRVARALDLVHLSAHAQKKPRQLSGGQQQRVGIARCLSYDTVMILMDEPLGALDKALREELQLELSRLHRSLGMTIIYVTHDQQEALRLSDRVVLMSDGQVVQIAKPAELYFQPRSEFAASFVGTTNMLSGIVQSGGTTLLIGKTTLDCGAALGHPGDSVKVMVRPECVRIAGSQDTSDNLLTGTIGEKFMNGSITRILIELTGGLSLWSDQLTSRATADYSVGGTVQIQIARNDITRLDEEVGRVPGASGGTAA
jgi:putative spermidine/putrescine transport system ATP-binding protein